MVNAGQRTRLWEEWLAAEMRADYFADLSASYRTRQAFAIWLTLFFSSGAVVAVVTLLARRAQELEWLAIALPVAAAAVSLYSIAAQNISRAVDAADLHFRWNRLAIEYHNLWDAIDADGADIGLARLSEKGAEISKSGTAFPYSEKRMLKWYELVLRQHSVRAPA